jgi:hypothetical protein
MQAPPSHRRVAIRAFLVVALVLIVGLAVAAVQAKRIHDRYGTWALSPGAHTPVIPFHGRKYDRGDRLQVLPADVEEVGSAPSNGEIFSVPPIPSSPGPGRHRVGLCAALPG